MNAAVKEAWNKLLVGLDSNHRANLKAALTTTFDAYCADAPGPDKVTRPMIAAMIGSFVDDICTGI